MMKMIYSGDTASEPYIAVWGLYDVPSYFTGTVVRIQTAE
jgi:hypothetical protein